LKWLLLFILVIVAVFSFGSGVFVGFRPVELVFNASFPVMIVTEVVTEVVEVPAPVTSFYSWQKPNIPFGDKVFISSKVGYAVEQLNFVNTFKSIEWSSCLYGRVDNGWFNVSRMSNLGTVSANVSGVIVNCERNSELLGLMHSHPSCDLRLSDTDVKTVIDGGVMISCVTCGFKTTLCYSASDSFKDAVFTLIDG